MNEDWNECRNGTMQEQSATDILHNAIATKLKDCKSFSGKLQRAVQALHLYVARANEQRLSDFAAKLAEQGQASPWQRETWWTFSSICFAMENAGVPPLIEVVVAEYEVRVLGEGIPESPLDPGIRG